MLVGCLLWVGLVPLGYCRLVSLVLFLSGFSQVVLSCFFFFNVCLFLVIFVDWLASFDLIGCCLIVVVVFSFCVALHCIYFLCFVFQ